MRILHNGADHLIYKQEIKKVKKQRNVCPHCGKRRNVFVKFLEDRYNRRYVRDRLYSVYYVCVCNRCQAVWETDHYKVII